VADLAVGESIPLAVRFARFAAHIDHSYRTLVTRLIHRLIPPSMSNPQEYATAHLNYLQPVAFE
jgi:hypothetical protein